MADFEKNVFTLKVQKIRRELGPVVNDLQKAISQDEIVDVLRALIILNKVARLMMVELKEAVERISDE